MANNLTVVMDMVCNLVLQPHGNDKLHSNDKLHNHYSFAVVVDGKCNLTISKLKSNDCLM